MNKYVIAEFCLAIILLIALIIGLCFNYYLVLFFIIPIILAVYYGIKMLKD